MNNLEAAKEALMEKKRIANIIAPPKKQRGLIPSKKDIKSVQDLLTGKANSKRWQWDTNISQEEKKKYKKEIDAINTKALKFKKEINVFLDRIKKESNGTLEGGHTFWNSLPDGQKEIRAEGDFLRRSKSALNKNLDEIDKEINTYIENLSIGTAKLEDARPLLDKIEKL